MYMEKTGQFIKYLREEKKLSQEQLADLLNCDRTKVNKIENGKRFPSVDDLILLSQIFEISIEELVAGEFEKKSNKKQIDFTFWEYLKFQNTKLKKMKLIIIITLFVLFFILCVFSILYFCQNYRSVKVYKFSGSSENYEISDGLLVLSKKQIYIYTGKITPYFSDIILYSKDNNEKRILYSGESEVLLNDFYGYNAIINYKDFESIKEKIYINVDNQEIKLNFVEEFINDSFVYFENVDIGNNNSNNMSLKIPDKIQSEFDCYDNTCTLNTNGMQLIYADGFLSGHKDKKIYTYDIYNKKFQYSELTDEGTVSFEYSDNDIICITGNCESAKSIYETFKKLYIDKYLFPI